MIRCWDIGDLIGAHNTDSRHGWYDLCAGLVGCCAAQGLIDNANAAKEQALVDKAAAEDTARLLQEKIDDLYVEGVHCCDDDDVTMYCTC